MAKSASKKRSPAHRDAPLELQLRKPVPFQFVLDAIEPLKPTTRPMFSCLAVYVGSKIVFCLRDKPTNPADNGMWLATTHDHHASLHAEFPSMRSIGVLGKAITGWQVFPSQAPDFEESALRACELIRAGDARIGKIPKRKNPKK